MKNNLGKKGMMPVLARKGERKKGGGVGAHPRVRVWKRGKGKTPENGLKGGVKRKPHDVPKFLGCWDCAPFPGRKRKKKKKKKKALTVTQGGTWPVVLLGRQKERGDGVMALVTQEREVGRPRAEARRREGKKGEMRFLTW